MSVPFMSVLFVYVVVAPLMTLPLSIQSRYIVDVSLARADRVLMLSGSTLGTSPTFCVDCPSMPRSAQWTTCVTSPRFDDADDRICLMRGRGTRRGIRRAANQPRRSQARREAGVRMPTAASDAGATHPMSRIQLVGHQSVQCRRVHLALGCRCWQPTRRVPRQT
jgi:hypothetical protein